MTASASAKAPALFFGYDGRIVLPFTQHQVEDAPGLSSGRHADEDPWRSKTYWYYEDYAVARA